MVLWLQKERLFNCVMWALCIGPPIFNVQYNMVMNRKGLLIVILHSMEYFLATTRLSWCPFEETSLGFQLQSLHSVLMWFWTVSFVFEGTLHNSGLVSTHFEITERNFIDKTDAEHTSRTSDSICLLSSLKFQQKIFVYVLFYFNFFPIILRNWVGLWFRFILLKLIELDPLMS